jgi:hypothetical protein
MRKCLAIVLLISVLMSLSVLPAAAEPKPTLMPHEVVPGDADFAATFGSMNFDDLWFELERYGYELPQTGTESFLLWQWQVDDFLRGRQRGDGGIEGIPLGFTFHHMQGPPNLAPGWQAAVPPGGSAADLPSDWPVLLEDEGYDKVYVSTNGFLVFDDPEVQEFVAREVCEKDCSCNPCGGHECEEYCVTEWHWEGAGNWNWWPWQIPIREPPDNFIAPYWTDLAIGDNSYTHVQDISYQCVIPDLFGWGDGECMQYEMVPSATVTIPRPRGRLLYATVGEEPNRRFIVEWLNARNRHTGNLCTFQVQLYEGSSATLFLYKDFQTKDASGTYFETPAVVIGMEDYYGASGVGTAFTMEGASIGRMLPIPGMPSWRGIVMNWLPKAAFDLLPWWIFGWMTFGFKLPPPRAAGDMVGYVY